MTFLVVFTIIKDMKLSDLQKFIMKKAYMRGKGKVPRILFVDFYNRLKNSPTKKMQINVITQSLERLIEKGLVIGYGKKTQEKLFIETIQLTTVGKKVVKDLLKKQTPLPFPKKK
jgi:hypothetical protein